MNFICEKCKQKYHVADEKLQGRAVTRFRCKKCDHIIELEAPTQTALGSASAGASATTSSSPSPVRPVTIAVPAVRSSTPAGKPRPSTTTGPAFGATGVTSARAATMATPAVRSATASERNARPASAERSWYAGIRDVPVGPLSRAELASRVQSGEVTPDTLVWREGLDDWRPLQKVVELSDLLRTSPAASGPSEAARPPRTPPGARAAVVDDDEEATRVSGLDPSLAGIMGKGRGRTETDKPEAPKASRAGLSPLACAPASPAAPARAPATPAGRDPAPSAAHALEATATEASASSSPGERETPSGSKRAGEKPLGSEQRPGTETSGAIKRPEEELLDELFAKPAKATGAPTSRPPVESLPLLTPPASPAGSASRSSPPPSSPPAAPSASEVSGSSALVSSSEPVAQDSSKPEVAQGLSLLPSVQVPAQPPAPSPASPSARSLPPTVWLMMVGMLLAGLLGGLYLGRMRAPSLEATPPPLRPAPQSPPSAPGVTVPEAGTLDVALAAPRGEAPTPASLQQSTMALRLAAPRADALLQAFQRSGVVRACWESTLAQRPNLAATTVTIDLHADARGRLAAVEVAQSPDPRFDACLRGRLGAVTSIGDGEAVDARATVALSVSP